MAQRIDVVRAERAENASASRAGRHPRQRTRLACHVPVEKKLHGAKLEAPDVALGEKLLDVGPLGRMPELVADHRRLAAAFGSREHGRRPGRIEGERLLAQHVFSGLQRGDRELIV